MREIIELSYILVIMLGVTVFAMQAVLTYKNLDTSNGMVKNKNTTVFMALIVVFNVCDFLIVFLDELLGEGVNWIFVLENLIEVAAAYALIAMERDCAGAAPDKRLPLFFIIFGSIILWLDTFYTAGILHITEHAYTVFMCLLNLIPVLVFAYCCTKYMKVVFTVNASLAVKIYFSVYNTVFVLLCIVTTVNMVDSRTEWDYVAGNEQIYIASWIVFNLLNIGLIWCSCRLVTVAAPLPEESTEQKLETAALRFGLSCREKEIALMICKGMNNGDIAKKLYLSTNTVKVHASNLYRKIGACNRMQAMRIIKGENTDEWENLGS